MNGKCYTAVRTCYNDNAFTENYHNNKCCCADARKLFNTMKELTNENAFTEFRFISSKVIHIAYNGQRPKDFKINVNYEKLNDTTINCIVTLTMTRPVGNEIKTNDDVLTVITENTFEFKTKEGADLSNHSLKVNLFGVSFPYIRSYINSIMGCTEYPITIGLISPASVIKE